ncbi:MAG: DMT family transporter [Candidatus Accumulibacter meliphilus]|jgi:drug/metabolite transporter (DMT)-like permease|uniref:DMT family transporter n=1 Tax=Candidatus Accumulibacter meliphilus TaxID=2211374 RepID=A0A369XNV3_9PROT|nr:MAG: DMT family transporter [Candidatus Accumulibacter meliphilus]
MSLPPSLLPFLFVFLWSTGFIGAKFGLPYAEPLTFLLTRYLLVLTLMLPFVLLTRAPWPANPRQFFHIAVSGVLVHGVYLGGVFMAIKHGLPAGVTALVVGMQPLLTACGAGFLLGERVSPRQWLGLALGFAGVSLVVANKLGDVPLAAMLVPAIAALLGITLGTLYQKRFCPRFDLRTGSVIQFLPTAIITALVASATESMAIEWTPQFVFALLWLVLVLSVGAISLLNVLIRSGSAVNVATLFYLTPPSTAIIAWLLFDETLSGLAVAGMVLAVSGVYLARATPR